MESVEKKIFIVDEVDIAVVSQQPFCRPGIKENERVSGKKNRVWFGTIVVVVITRLTVKVCGRPKLALNFGSGM